ncbi:MAG TPA: hypothetical protein P5567_13650 [Kiritimatiellia bacterium]|nr:hypothetical protein [Kiritimatiellia bacterium]HRZ13488.1 hypothetical protein [Kiritimatiellia bacterium]HSA19207.1 hypothetical protein [Kiritimatiellia bacterium]
MPFLINPAVDVSGQFTEAWEHRLASDGSIGLAVWADNGSDEIKGMRLDAQGRPLDTVALLIAPNSVGAYATERRYPAVMWFQDAFWVIWQEHRGSGPREGLGRRMYPDGRFADTTPFPVETCATSAYRSCVCAGGTNLLMTWSAYSNTYRLWAQTCSPAGQPVGAATQVMAGFSGYVQPGLAYGNFAAGEKSFLLAVAISNDIRGLRLSEGGAVLDAAPLPICVFPGTQANPCPAFGPGPGGTQGWWVAWQDSRSGTVDIHGAFVAQDGTVSHSSTGMAFITAASDQVAPSLAWDGSRYLLAWHDYRSPPAFRASVMDSGGGFADTNGTLVSTNDPSTPVVCARTNGSFLAAHGDETVWGQAIEAQDSLLTAGTQRLASVAGAGERYNSGGCDGTNFWVAFEYHPAHSERLGDIAIQRVSPGGIPLAAAPFLVCTNSSDQWAPAAAVGRDTVYVVWTDERNPRDQVWGQRLTLDGQPAGTNVQIGVGATFAYFCDIASDGTNFLAVWDDSDSGKTRGRFVRADGSMGGAFDIGGSDISDPFVTFGGGCYLVLCADDAAIRFRRYRPGGTAIDTSASNLYSGSSVRWEPQAAYHAGGNRFLVTWRDQAAYQILGRTLDASTAALGNVITVLVINAWASSANSAVACDGTDWLCLFRDTRNGPAGLFGARVDAGGALLDAAPFPILRNATFGELVPPAAPLTNVLILGTRPVYDTPGRVYNTGKSLGLFWQPGAQESPGPDVEGRHVRIDAFGQTAFFFRQSAPASTGYVVETCASLANPDWRPVTNGVLLDSGMGVSALWREPGGAASSGTYRARGN